MSNVLAVAEHRRGELRDVSHEVITAGADLAAATGGDVHLAVISGDVETFAADLNRGDVDAIHTVADGEEFNHGVYVQALEALAAELDPEYIVTPNSVNGLDYAPAVADSLDMSVVTDAVEVDAEDGLTVTREFYGGKTEGELEVFDDRAVVTIREGEWPAAEGEADAPIEAFDADIDESALGTTVNGFEEAGSGDVDITEADVLVSIGRGIDEEDNIPLIEELVDTMGATLSSSRPIVDNGWLPQDRQVGQSGKKVTPDVYIAIGISGAVQHVAGMKGADTIIAINNDPSAPIFDIADYGIVDDLFDVVPALTEQFA
jgi:electron transfer flavoprotein alpha subunit